MKCPKASRNCWIFFRGESFFHGNQETFAALKISGTGGGGYGGLYCALLHSGWSQGTSSQAQLLVVLVSRYRRASERAIALLQKKAVPLCIKLSRSTRGRVFACSAGSARFFSPLIYTGEPLRKHTHNDGRKQKHVPCILHNPFDSSPSETRFPSLTHYENLDLLLPSAFFS